MVPDAHGEQGENKKCPNHVHDKCRWDGNGHQTKEGGQHEAEGDDGRVALAKGARRVGALEIAVGEAQCQRMHQPKRRCVDGGTGHTPSCERLAGKGSAVAKFEGVAQHLTERQCGSDEQPLARPAQYRHRRSNSKVHDPAHSEQEQPWHCPKSENALKDREQRVERGNAQPLAARQTADEHKTSLRCPGAGAHEREEHAPGPCEA